MPATWKESLKQLLSQRKAESGRSPQVAILGVGNAMRSDDAAGVLVARTLRQQEGTTDTERVLIIEAGPAPENRTGELRKFLPDLVFIIDAADMGKAPGTIQWISEESIDGMSASTHSLPLSMLAHYLQLDLGCNVGILGIQIRSNEVGEQLSPEVFQAVQEVIHELDSILYTD